MQIGSCFLINMNHCLYVSERLLTVILASCILNLSVLFALQHTEPKKGSKKMFCPHCGVKIEDTGNFCPACGGEILAVRRKRPPSGSAWKWIAIAGLAVAVCAVVFLIVLNALPARQSTNSDPSSLSGQVDAEINVPFDPAPSVVQEDMSAATVDAAEPVAALPASTPVPMAEYEWLEVQQVLQSKSANFVPLRWSYSGFRVGATGYSHGVGITLRGSSYESVVASSPDGVWTQPYSEVSLDIPCGKRFIKITFDIGFDNTDTSRWGAPEVNGYGRLLLLDVAADQILYDSGVKDYSFSEEFIAVDTSDVNVLRIIYQVSPVTEKQKNSLNLVLGKAMLYKYGDKYTESIAYTPALDALPTSYTQFEPYATDYIEKFILRGHRQKYAEEELWQFSREEMEYVLNGVYALSGKWFGTSDLWNYFTSKPWYYPIRADITDREKNSFQQANENTIVSYMKSLGWR